MSLFKPYKITSDKLEDLPIQEGQFIITTDNRKLYLDVSPQERIEVGGEGGSINPSGYVTTEELNSALEDYLPLSGGTLSSSLNLAAGRIAIDRSATSRRNTVSLASSGPAMYCLRDLEDTILNALELHDDHSHFTMPLDVSGGGTGANNSADARTNLGAAAANHTHTTLTYQTQIINATTDWDTLEAGIYMVNASKGGFSSTYHGPVGAYEYGAAIIFENGSSVIQIYIAHMPGDFFWRQKFSATQTFANWSNVVSNYDSEIVISSSQPGSSNSNAKLWIKV